MLIKKSSNIFIFFLTFLLLFSTCFAQKQEDSQAMQIQNNPFIKLPLPVLDGNVSLEKALSERRSIREYSEDSLSLAEISQLLWAAQGITKKIKTPPSTQQGNPWTVGLRTAPSAGATYPIELYIAAAKVKGLSQGLYKYNPQQHAIIKMMDGDKRADISNAALKQSSIRTAAANIIIFGNYNRTAFKYGNRAKRYVQIEVGAVSQNIYLQAHTLGIGTVLIGAFTDDSLKSTLNAAEDEYPLGIMPIGRI